MREKIESGKRKERKLVNFEEMEKEKKNMKIDMKNLLLFVT